MRAAYKSSAVGRTKARERLTVRLYGLTGAQIAAILDEQRGLCAVCQDELPGGNQTHIDHDHHTGQVRGVLCGTCNRAEGMLRGSQLLAERLAAYLRKHAPKLRLA